MRNPYHVSSCHYTMANLHWWETIWMSYMINHLVLWISKCLHTKWWSGNTHLIVHWWETIWMSCMRNHVHAKNAKMNSHNHWSQNRWSKNKHGNSRWWETIWMSYLIRIVHAHALNVKMISHHLVIWKYTQSFTIVQSRMNFMSDKPCACYECQDDFTQSENNQDSLQWRQFEWHFQKYFTQSVDPKIHL